MKNLTKEFEEKLKVEGLNCVMIDGRIDLTNILIEADGSEQSFPAKIKEEHYSVVSEPGGNYLFHFTPEESTKEESYAKKSAKAIYIWLKEKGLKSLYKL